MPEAAHDRIAGAPVSWGVCEVPGWGHQLPTGRVLAEMAGLGLRATELGPPGFLPEDGRTQAGLLADHGLRAVGGFLPVLLHDADHDVLPEVDAFVEGCLAVGADVVVLAAATGQDGYDRRPVLREDQWETLLGRLEEVAARVSRSGLRATLHPHLGTMVEGPEDVRRVLEGCSVSLCVDTGHLLAGGTDPVALTRDHPDRVGHVHLKDVDAALARRVLDGETSFSEAVRDGLFRVLGEGSVDVAALVAALEDHGYDGWYVLEQDLVLAGEPEGAGPAADVGRCLAYVEGLLA